jgi:esterase
MFAHRTLARRTLGSAPLDLYHRTVPAPKAKPDASAGTDGAADAAAPAPVLVLHGLLGSSSNWRTVSSHLARRTRRAFTLADLRNHGESPHSASMDLGDAAGDALALASGLAGRTGRSDFSGGSGSVALVGHSLGGKIAMRAAFARPALVERLVVVDIAPKRHEISATGPGSVLRAMRGLDLARVGSHAEAQAQLRDSIPDDTTRGFVLQNLVRNPDSSRSGGGGSSKFVWRVNLEALCAPANLDAMSAFPAPGPRALYEGPALFVFGGRSEVVAAEDHGTVHRHFPNAEIVTLPEAGHMPHFEARDAFVDTVARFLGE